MTPHSRRTIRSSLCRGRGEIIRYLYIEPLKLTVAQAMADVSALEAEIDRRVYALYELTTEEVRIVEGR